MACQVGAPGAMCPSSVEPVPVSHFGLLGLPCHPTSTAGPHRLEPFGACLQKLVNAVHHFTSLHAPSLPFLISPYVSKHDGKLVSLLFPRVLFTCSRTAVYRQKNLTKKKLKEEKALLICLMVNVLNRPLKYSILSPL